MKANGDKKVCSACKESLDLSCFRSNKTTSDGLHSQCKKCDNLARTERKRKNGDNWKKNNPHYATVQKAGLNKELVISLVSDHDGKCDICRKESDLLHLDHCHDTNEIRGFLCRECNLAIGIMQDNPERLEAAARYLRG